MVDTMLQISPEASPLVKECLQVISGSLVNSIMKPHLFLAALCLCDVGAFAQPWRGPEGADPVVTHQQRKAALRDALQTVRRRDAPVDSPAAKSVEAVPVARHLSPSELAEMREQLRRQQKADRVRP